MSKNNPRKQAAEAPEQGLMRRAFVKVALGGMGLCYAGAIGYPVYRYLKSPVVKAETAAAVTEVTLKDAQKLPVKSALMFKFGVEPCLLIHYAQDTWVALSAKCTHLGCTVQFEPAKNIIFCACHGGTYSPESGKNISGPPPKPLKRFEVKSVGETGVTVARA